MGEPCQGALHRKLQDLSPTQWVKAMMPEPVLPKPASPQATPSGDCDLVVRTLGRFQLLREDRVLVEDDWHTRKTMKLFARLCLSRGVAVSDDFLMVLFWPETDQVRSRNSLRNALHQVRQTVRKFLDQPRAKIVVRSRKTHTVTLELDFDLDFLRFEESLELAEEKAAQNRWPETQEIARNALKLYSGDFLEGVDDEWVLAPRVRLREAYLRCLGICGRAYLEDHQA